MMTGREYDCLLLKIQSGFHHQFHVLILKLTIFHSLSIYDCMLVVDLDLG